MGADMGISLVVAESEQPKKGPSILKISLKDRLVVIGPLLCSRGLRCRIQNFLGGVGL